MSDKDYVPRGFIATPWQDCGDGVFVRGVYHEANPGEHSFAELIVTDGAREEDPVSERILLNNECRPAFMQFMHEFERDVAERIKALPAVAEQQPF